MGQGPNFVTDKFGLILEIIWIVGLIALIKHKSWFKFVDRIFWYSYFLIYSSF